MTAALKPIPGPMPQTPEWKAMRLFDPDRKERPVVFGGSEGAEACGVSRYGTRLGLYLIKRREIEDPEDTPQQAMRKRMGTRMEGPVLDEYQTVTSRVVSRFHPMYFHPEHSFMGATPDGIAITSHERPTWELSVDAKTSNWRMLDTEDDDVDKFGAEGTDQIPSDYVIQAQQQMAVLGLDRCDFPVLFDMQTLKIYTVQRNDELIAMMVAAQKELAERIINGDPPEAQYGHQETRRLLHEMYGMESGKVVVLPREALTLWNNVQKLRNSKNSAEYAEGELVDKFLAMIENAEIVRFENSAIEVKRTRILDTHWCDADVEQIRAKIGTVNRRGHSRLSERKAKKK